MSRRTFEIDESTRGPTERPSAAQRWPALYKGFSKQFGNNRSPRTAFPLVESLDLSQNGVVDIQCRLRDACLEHPMSYSNPKTLRFRVHRHRAPGAALFCLEIAVWTNDRSMVKRALTSPYLWWSDPLLSRSVRV